MDLFEHLEQAPESLQNIVTHYAHLYEHGDTNYETTRQFLSECNKIGYTFSYCLDNIPYDLRSLGVFG